jgi:LysM repeat protein
MIRIIGQVILGLLTSLLAGALVIGSVALVFVEKGMPVSRIVVSLLAPESRLLIFLTPNSGELAELGNINENLYTPTFPPPPANCPPPLNWMGIIVKPDDNLTSLADMYRTTKEELVKANCLLIDVVLPGTILYVPMLPVSPTFTFTFTPTLTSTFIPTMIHKPSTDKPCTPPSGWVIYIVRRGDTLYSIGLMYGVSWQTLQQANCLGSSTNIVTGQALYVPNVIPRIPTTEPTRTAVYPTSTTYFTNTPGIPTATIEPTITDTVLPSATLTPIPTAIPQPSDTSTSAPTNTPKHPTNTPVPTVESTPTPTKEHGNKP